MTEKFDPAPPDRYAEKPGWRVSRDKKPDTELDQGLKDSFPASDSPSTTQPSKTINDAE